MGTAKTWRAARRALGRAFALVAITALIVGLVRANARYFYCPLMDSVASASCCTETHDRSAEPTIDQSDCCETHRIASVPQGAAVASPPVVPDAPFVAYVTFAALAYVLGHTALLAVPVANAPGAGPPPLSPGEARSRTMVFLI